MPRLTPRTLAISTFTGATLAPALAAACGNAMVTPTPMTYVAQAAIVLVPIAVLGAIVFLAYKKTRLTRVWALVIFAVLGIASFFITILPALFAGQLLFSDSESYESHDTRVALEAAIAKHTETGTFPGGVNYSYSNYKGPGAKIDCALPHADGELDAFDRTTPEGKKAAEVLEQLGGDVNMQHRHSGSQVVYSTNGKEGDEAVAKIEFVLDRATEYNPCILMYREARYDAKEGKFVIGMLETREVGEKLPKGGEEALKEAAKDSESAGSGDIEEGQVKDGDAKNDEAAAEETAAATE